jgi:hypothetical protein
MRLESPRIALEGLVTGGPIDRTSYDTDASTGEWGRFRRDVDNRQAAGPDRGEAIRLVYREWFGVDLGPIDPARLAWLWEAAK